MNLFGAGSRASGSKPASQVRSEGMKRAAKAAKRGGSGIRQPKKAAPPQQTR